MEQILKCALEELSQGRTAVLAVVTASQGSTPRSAGAAMLVGESGLLTGTIGGGNLEYRCCQIALDPENSLMTFSLDNQQAAGLGMVCGGSVQVLFVKLEDKEMLQQALLRAGHLEPGWLLLPLSGERPSLETEDLPPEPRLVSRDGETYLSLPLAQPGKIFLLGGGHVSHELSRILDVLGYPYVVVDDRAEFADPSRYPNAGKVAMAEFDQLDTVLSGHLAPGPLDCICIMTRGHLHDMEAMQYALTTPAGYIGLMGSRKKRERMFAQLEADGFFDAPQRITTPIGLNIGGQTPAEVAISIAAQLVQHRCQKKA